MENSFYGVVIKVENLDICRSFYRDILELGPPVVDSNFWVEFRIQEGVSLVLERVSDEEVLPQVSRERLSWLYRVNDTKGILERLERYGFEPVSRGEEERFGFEVQVFCDPEGNPFYLLEKQDESAEG